jgi:hypothetical protein
MGTKVSGLEHVTKLIQSEAVLLDPDRLDGLYAQLGTAGAEDIICRAMEELAIRMAQCERMYRQEKWKDLRKLARSLVAISDQIGMTLLSRVASDVTRAVDGRDVVATAATLSRLLRIGEKSLTQIWDLQDMTV